MRDPKEWAADVDSSDVINVYSSCEFEVNREGLADLIREAQEDGAKAYREQLAHIALIAQTASTCEPEQGLHSIHGMATEDHPGALGGTIKSDDTIEPERCLICSSETDVIAGLCTPCLDRGELPF